MFHNVCVCVQSIILLKKPKKQNIFLYIYIFNNLPFITFFFLGAYGSGMVTC